MIKSNNCDSYIHCVYLHIVMVYMSNAWMRPKPTMAGANENVKQIKLLL